MTDLSPREIVSELDRFIVGQDEAKRAVAVALRNRWRRKRVPDDLRDQAKKMGLFGYALLNFVLGMVDTPVRQDADESTPSPGNVRLFSGHWMLFYAAAFATLYSAIHDTGLLKGRKCTRGHDGADRQVLRRVRRRREP